MSAVQVLGDHQAEHRVTEELEPLVGRQAAVLVRVGPVGQGKREQLGVHFDAERFKQNLGIAGRAFDRFPRHRFADDQAGAVTWRPSYWPHFGQARCDGLGALQARFEHSTRCTALVFHCDRRDRVFERDIFRFGTATTSSPQFRHEPH